MATYHVGSRPVPAALECPLGTAYYADGQPGQPGCFINLSCGPLSLATRAGW